MILWSQCKHNKPSDVCAECLIDSLRTENSELKEMVKVKQEEINEVDILNHELDQEIKALKAELDK